jgi:hypothetical protein
MTDYDYDTAYKDATIQVLLDTLEDLEKWSAYNGDKYNELISAIKTSLKIMRGE